VNKIDVVIYLRLLTDGRYFWRVDKVLSDTTELTGPTWVFYTQPAVPDITVQPAPYTLVNAGDPVTLSVTVTDVPRVVLH